MPSSAYKPAPNRFASEQEAAILRAQIAAYEEDQHTAELRVAEADLRRHKANAAVRAAEQALFQAREAQQTAGAGHACAVQRVAALQSDIRTSRAFLNPVRKTPLEVLGLVFEQVADEMHADLSLTGHDEFQRVPFALAAVCQRWRRVAQASTKLWSRVVFEFSIKSTGHASRVLAWQVFLEAHIARSGSRLIELTLLHDDQHSCQHTVDLYCTLQKLVARAGSVHITFSPECCQTFYAFMKSRAPKLQHARIETFFPPAPTIPPTFDFFQNAHSLRSLYLHHCIPKWKSASFQSVTKLKAEWMVLPVMDVVEMMAAMPKVHDLTIEATSILDTDGLVCGEHVRRLDIAVDVLSERTAGVFRFPALSELVLRFPRYNPAVPQRNFPTARRLAFLGALGARVTRLRVDSTKLDERFAAALGGLSTLEVLETRNAWLAPSFFARLALVLPNGGGPACPSLHTLTLDACNIPRDFNPETLLAFVRARMETGARPGGAKRVTVRMSMFGDTVRPPWLQELAQLQEA